MKYLLTEAVNKEGVSLEGIVIKSFRGVASATFVNSDTGEILFANTKELINKAKKKLHSKALWSDIELNLCRCMRFMRFEAEREQPYCISRDYWDEVDSYGIQPDWIPYFDFESYQSEILSGEVNVYFGEYTMETAMSDVLSSWHSEFSIYHPVKRAIECGLLRHKDGVCRIPIIRNNIRWRDSDDIANGEGTFYNKADFVFKDDADSEFDALFGYLVFEVIDTGRLAKLVLLHGR